MIYYLLKYILMPIYFLFRMPRIFGRENLKSIKSGKAVIICNHRSMLDPIFLALTTNRFIHFMAKAELFNNKVLGTLLKGLLVFPVNRCSTDVKALKQALEVLDKGCVFGIFPEGTRSITNDVDTFENGAAFLAMRAEAPILPMYIPANNYKLFKRPRLYIGKLITPDEYNFTGSKSAAVKKLTHMLEERVDELKKLSEE